MQLFDYQNEGVEFVQSNKKVYLAFDMGMGKTITSLVSMTTISDENILIIAEKNEVVNSENFRKEVEEYLPDWDFFNLREVNTEDVPEIKAICIINPEGLAKIKHML